MRILVAEDDARLLKSLVHIFQLNTYSVDGVSNGQDAYEYARTGEYDGLILDVMKFPNDGFMNNMLGGAANYVSEIDSAMNLTVIFRSKELL